MVRDKQGWGCLGVKVGDALEIEAGGGGGEIQKEQKGGCGEGRGGEMDVVLGVKVAMHL